MCCWIWFCSWILFIYFSSCRTWLLVLKFTLSFYLETRGWQLPALLELYLIKVTHALLYLGSRLWLTQSKPCCSIGGVGVGVGVLSNSAKCCECLSERPLTTFGSCPPFHHHVCTHFRSAELELLLQPLCTPGGAACSRPTETTVTLALVAAVDAGQL